MIHRSTALALTAALLASGCATETRTTAPAPAAAAVANPNPTVGGAEMFATRNIIENALDSPIHTTLVAAVKAAGLVDTLSGPGPFTVFAPTDDAFAALPPGTVETLLLPENKAKLTEILTYHVVPANATSDVVGGMIADHNGAHAVTTVSGGNLIATNRDGVIRLSDAQGRVATVTTADVLQSNGVIHVIDTVLLPN